MLQKKLPLSLMKTLNSIKIQKKPLRYPFFSKATQATETPIKISNRTALRKETTTLQGRGRTQLLIWRRAPWSVQRRAESNFLVAQFKQSLRSLKVYNKQNFFPVCFKTSLKIARHLEARHGDVEDVARAFSYLKNSTERRNALHILGHRGNFAHNARVVQKRAEELQVCYRSQKAKTGTELILCFNCQGLYSKKTLWKQCWILHQQVMKNPGLGRSEFNPNVYSKLLLSMRLVMAWRV